jgi:hypothetical protein
MNNRIDNRWLVQGTLGVYNEQRNALYVEGHSPEYHQWPPRSRSSAVSASAG